MNKACGRLVTILSAGGLLANSAVALAAEPADNLRSAKLEVTAPETLEGFSRNNPAPKGQLLDYQFNYDTAGDSITVYIFRATHPNAALWFERADSVLNVGRKSWQLSDATPIERITAFGAAAPNGLRRAYRASQGMKSTALAVVQVNDWIVKVRSSSTTLDRDAQLARLDRVIAALAVKAALRPAHPLELPMACDEKIDSVIASLVGGKLIEKPSSTHTLTAGLLATDHARSLAGGKDSLAAEPNAYCKGTLVGPMAEVAALYRAKSGDGHWEVLFADSGRSFSGHAVPFDKAAPQVSGFGMMTVNDFDRSSVVFLTEGSPDPGISSDIGAMVVTGRMRGAPLTAVHYDSNQIDVNIPRGDKK